MTYLDMGEFGWQIDNNNPVDEQQEKVDAVAYATENVLRALGKVVKIYAEFANPAMFRAFENAVSEAMEKGKYENFFNDQNYEGDSGKS